MRNPSALDNNVLLSGLCFAKGKWMFLATCNGEKKKNAVRSDRWVLELQAIHTSQWRLFWISMSIFFFTQPILHFWPFLLLRNVTVLNSFSECPRMTFWLVEIKYSWMYIFNWINLLCTTAAPLRMIILKLTLFKSCYARDSLLCCSLPLQRWSRAQDQAP